MLQIASSTPTGLFYDSLEKRIKFFWKGVENLVYTNPLLVRYFSMSFVDVHENQFRNFCDCLENPYYANSDLGSQLLFELMDYFEKVCVRYHELVYNGCHYFDVFSNDNKSYDFVCHICNCYGSIPFGVMREKSLC